MLASQDLKSIPQLFSYLNSVYKKFTISTRVFIAYLEKDMSIIEINNLAKNYGLISEFKKKSEDLYFFTIGARVKFDVGYLIAKKDYWIFITDSDGRSTQRFIRNLHPILKLLYVNSDNILNLIQDNSKKFEYVNFVEGTLCSKGETFRNWKKEPIKFSIRSLKKMSEKDKAKWTGLTLVCNFNEENGLKFRINEQGNLALYKGQFTDFYDTFVLPYISEGIRIKNNFSNKERKVRDGEVALSPLFLDVREELSMKDIGILKKAFLNNYMGAVVHAGNPVLMMQITDKSDGSSFDVYASRRKIEVVPLVKSSSASLISVFSLISDMLPYTKFDVRGAEVGF